jgi:hypothetical protein
LFLGIIAQLTQATNGIGVILEHRYYGTSFPTPNISTENLRFLTTEQALADQAYFSQHIKFPGMVSPLHHLEAKRMTDYLAGRSRPV